MGLGVRSSDTRAQFYRTGYVQPLPQNLWSLFVSSARVVQLLKAHASLNVRTLCNAVCSGVHYGSGKVTSSLNGDATYRTLRVLLPSASFSLVVIGSHSPLLDEVYPKS